MNIYQTPIEKYVSIEDVAQTRMLIAVIIGLITIIGAILSVIRWWVNKLIKSSQFRTGTTADISVIMAQMDKLCDRIHKQENKLEEKINALIKEQKEVSAINDISIHEIIKDMHDMKGQVNELSKLLQTVVRSSLDK